MKQYLLLCDETGIEGIKSVFKNIQLLEVQGMSMGQGNNYNLMITPILPPLRQTVIPEQSRVPDET